MPSPELVLIYLEEGPGNFMGGWFQRRYLSYQLHRLAWKLLPWNFIKISRSQWINHSYAWLKTFDTNKINIPCQPAPYIFRRSVFILLSRNILQNHHMKIKASEIYGNLTVQQLGQSTFKGYQRFLLLAFVRITRWWLMHSHHKGPVMKWKVARSNYLYDVWKKELKITQNMHIIQYIKG